MFQVPKPLALFILDGWGYSETDQHNPLCHNATPFLNKLWEKCPHTLLDASGGAVGLPDGQMGNSEVGHIHLGAGRPAPQDLVRINQAIQDGTFATNSALNQALDYAKQSNKQVHILGLLSHGGVHSMQAHIQAMIRLAVNHGLDKVYLHAFLDGRDTPPCSAEANLEEAQQVFDELGIGRIASICGRYYAMDRDQRWERIERAYNLLTIPSAPFTAPTAIEAIKLARARDESDEFVQPTLIATTNQSPIAIEDGDVVIFMNFRADRARQLCYALTEENFSGFKRIKNPKLGMLITMTQYDKNLKSIVAFPPLSLHNTLGEYLASLGYHQLRIAETEKYAHVTYFFNGGVETPYQNEERILIPSPKVATYDLQPEMSAYEVTDALVNAINQKKFDVIICNFANPDMVGHTGNYDAAVKAMHVVDDCLKRIVAALQEIGGAALITADHGNIEMMFDPQTQQAHTAHTTNPVPLIYTNHDVSFTTNHGGLIDVAPTMLYLLNLKQPVEMTGHNLLMKNGP